MGRVYTVGGENMTITTGLVIVAMQPKASGAGSVLRILRVEVSQSGTTTSGQVRIAQSSRNLSGSLTMTSATPAPLVLGGPASAITGGGPLTAGQAGVNAALDSGGTYVDTFPAAPNNVGGYVWVATPAEQIYVPPGIIYAVRFLAAPASTPGWTAVVVYEEVF